MNIETMSKLKELELDILKYVHEVCVKNDLKYYLIGGTLLGAVRHKGFIPWDDDIDIVMFRNDYNSLLKVLEQNIDSRYFVQNFNTDKMYTRYITKIRLNGTIFLEKHLKDYNMNHGVFIDIFPIDKISNTNAKLIDTRVWLSNILLAARQIRNGQLKITNKIKKSFLVVLKPIVLLIPPSYYAKLIDFVYGYENKKNCKFVTNFSSQYGWRKQTFPIDVYGEGTCLEFEGYQFMAPAKWEVILKSLYGDYMKLPPEEKRSSGHDVIHIDLGKYAEN